MSAPNKFWPRSWRAQVLARIATAWSDACAAARGRKLPAGPLDDDLRATPPQVPTSEWERLCAIREHLHRAREFAQRKHRFADWVTGYAIDGAWRHLHAAESDLLLLREPGTLTGEVPHVLAVVGGYLPEHDPRRVALENQFPSGPSAKIDEVDEKGARLLATALRGAHYFGAVDHGNVRTFRNALLAGFIGLSALALTVVLFAAWKPNALSLCIEASQTQQQTDQTLACPANWQDTDAPARWDVPLVALFGLLGAGLAAIRALSGLSTPATRYSLDVPQILIKAPFGIITAIIGVLVLKSGFVPGFEGLTDPVDILVWAFAFGYAQQLLTGLVDRRAEKLLNQASPATPAG